MVLLTGRTLLAGIVATAASATVLVASPASAATTSTGVRCTIVGTSGSDRLTGTSHRDVICGRGGSDRILARGGNDVVDGGTGNDRIYGGFGADTVLGGSGTNEIYGESGADVIRGGPYSDAIYAGAGSDHVYAAGGRDYRVFGGTGNDVLAGGTGNDILNGGDGSDEIVGDDGSDTLNGQQGIDRIRGGNQSDLVHAGSGDDRVWGGAGNDQIHGESGADVVLGESGTEMIWGGDHADRLNGGLGRDEIWGDGGADTCRYDIYDWILGCEPDTKAPVVHSISISPSTIDTRTSDVKVKVRVHASDDGQIGRIQGHLIPAEGDDSPIDLYMPSLALVSGGVRDGWWEETVTVPRGTPAGSVRANIGVSAWTGPSGSFVYGGSLTITNALPDREAPTVAVQSLSATSIDVRSAARTVKVTVHGSDAIAGVGRIDICLSRMFPDGRYVCEALNSAVTRTSGTINSGTWSTALTVPKGSPSGVYNVEVYAQDRVGSASYWMGPESFAAMAYEKPNPHELPASVSRVQVTGS
ncbi:calcium-binding protein [Nocardioides sp. YJ-D4]